jgi:hypothetical protein
MSLRLTAALVALVVASGPTLACMGPTVIFQDDFQSANPAWDINPTGIAIPIDFPVLSIADGAAELTPLAGEFAVAVFGDQFFPSSQFSSFDACVDVTSPSVADPTQAAAGIAFGQTGSGFYVFAAQEDGQAAVAQFQQQTWSYLAPWQAAQGINTGTNATNTLRVTVTPAAAGATGSNATFYVNGVKFTTLALPSLQAPPAPDRATQGSDVQQILGTKLGLWAEGDPGTNAVAGATWSFRNLKITNVPSP